MRLETPVTFPIPVRGATSYKNRVKQMFTEQIPFLFNIACGGGWWYWLLIWWVFPFWLVYSCIVLVELVLITILFPIACVPYLRFISYLFQSLCFGIGFVIAFIGLIPQTYDDYEPSKKTVERRNKKLLEKTANKLLKCAEDLSTLYGLKDSFCVYKDKIQVEISSIIKKFPFSAHEHTSSVLAATLYHICFVEDSIQQNARITPTESQKAEIIELLAQYINEYTVSLIPNNDFDIIKRILLKWCVENGYIKGDITDQ